MIISSKFQQGNMNMYRALSILLGIGALLQLLGIPGYYHTSTQLFSLGVAVVLLIAAYLVKDIPATSGDPQ